MTLSDYIIFTTVSELKNMSLASDKLYLTRSAISHAISRIEREIGFPLFIKNTHGIELTDNGAALLPLAYAVIQNHQHFNEKIAAINGLASGNVRLGTCSSICINWIPELVNNFRHHYPDIQIHIFAGINNAQIVKKLEQNEIDIGISSYYSCDTISSSAISSTVIYEDEMVCVANSDFHTSTPGIITAEELQNSAFIISDQDYGVESRSVLEKLHLNANSTITATDDAGLVAMASAGLGFCILGRLILKGTTSPCKCLFLPSTAIPPYCFAAKEEYNTFSCCRNFPETYYKLCLFLSKSGNSIQHLMKNVQWFCI